MADTKKVRMRLMEMRERTRTPYPGMTDSVLAQHYLAGDQQAFEVLVQRYSGPLFTFIRRFLGGEYDAASDILQQVMLQLYLSLPKLRTGEPLKAWLYQVARNRCLDELRRKRAIPFSELEKGTEEEEQPLLDTMQDLSPLPEEVVERREVQEILLKAIRALPPKFRAVVLLRYVSQLSYAEIGRVLHMQEATAKTYFQRVKPLLRNVLAAQLQVVPAH
jgi:RNA polymerase sigma factor (sigma-70 family)